MVTIGDKVTVKHLKYRDSNGQEKLIVEEGVVIDTMQEPLERIKVDFEGDRYPRALWISPRLLRSYNDIVISTTVIGVI